MPHPQTEPHSYLEPEQLPDMEEKIKLMQYENLFQQVRKQKKLYDEIAALKGEKFNIFKILKVHADEVRLHSRFLAELLNPKGTHMQGAKFLKLFVHHFEDFGFNEVTANVTIEKNIIIEGENGVRNRRLDIYLRDEHGKEIIIENKIYAGDQPDQLYDYYQFASKGKSKLIYLTLQGDTPSDPSASKLKNDQHYFCFSYKEHIKEWLQACQKEVFDFPILRETIKQYLINLGFLTNQSTNQNFIMAIEEILIDHDNYRLIKNINQAFVSLKINSMVHLMNELHDKLKTLPGLENVGIFFSNRTDKINSDELKGLIQKYFQNNDVSQFGICIPLSSSSAPNLVFKIELNYSLYYGFANWQNERLTNLDDTNAIVNALASKPHLLTNFATTTDSLLYLRKLDSRVPFHNKENNENGLDILINSATRKIWIENFVIDIQEILELVQKE